MSELDDLFQKSLIERKISYGDILLTPRNIDTQLSLVNQG